MSTHQQPECESTCPNCNSSISYDPKHGERACPECGVIVSDNAVDSGPEWIAYTADERSRVGRPTTATLHDRGLTTQIDWRNTDAYGNSLTTRQRQKMHRLRKWNKRCRTRGREQILKQALAEIHRMSSALGLPHAVRETASVIYRRDYRLVADELGLALEPTDPTEYIPRFASKCGCSEIVQRQAHDLLTAIDGTTYPSGKSPVGLAAAALYASALLTEDPLTQGTLAAVADVTRVTIRTHYRELIARADDTLAEQTAVAKEDHR